MTSRDGTGHTKPRGLLDHVSYGDTPILSAPAKLYIISVEAVDIDSQTLCIIHYR